MTRAYKEYSLNDRRAIIRVDAPFDEALKALREEGLRYPISAEQLAEARIKAGKGHSLSNYGSYTGEGFVYLKGEAVLLERVSPLVRITSLAKIAVEANRNEIYFRTPGSKLYENLDAVARRDLSKAPQERTVLILPSRSNFKISPTVNPDIFKGLFGKSGERYLEFCGRDSLDVSLVGLSDVDSEDGTLLTQLWLCSPDLDSNVVGYYGDLDVNGGVRGVLDSAPKKHAEK